MSARDMREIRVENISLRRVHIGKAVLAGFSSLRCIDVYLGLPEDSEILVKGSLSEVASARKQLPLSIS